jgi:hypothetical protein
LKTIKLVLEALKIPFEKEDRPYDPEFVKMIKNAEKNEEGSIIIETNEDLKKYFESLEKDVQA